MKRYAERSEGFEEIPPCFERRCHLVMLVIVLAAGSWGAISGIGGFFIHGDIAERLLNGFVGACLGWGAIAALALIVGVVLATYDSIFHAR